MGRRMTLQEAALAVVQRLREHGHEALWAGGCVRDMLLGREAADIDVATDATPDRIVQVFKRTRRVGMKFGVVLVGSGGHWIETATFRSDLDYHDGRHPGSVVFTTAEHDAERRDFTINGLFYDPEAERVIDYVGGRQDLEAGVIRAIGEPEQRFAEDHLRMLRAVRFANRFGFRIAPATADAIRRHAAHITRISPERIREELERMLTDPSRAAAVRQLANLGLLVHLWPEAHWSAERLARVVVLLSLLPADADFTLSLAALLHESPPPEARRVGRELRCSNDQIADAAWLIEHIDHLEQTEILALPVFKRLIAHRRFDDLLALHRAFCVTRGLPLDSNDAARRRRAEIPPDEIAPPPLVTGDDLIAMGLQPGPAFKRILDTLYDEQLDERITQRDQALERMRELISDSSK